MIRREEVYKIGRVSKPHGVKGELSMHIDDDVFGRVDADYLILDIDGILVPFFMEEYRFRSDSQVLVVFTGVDTVEKAREYVGCDVYFPRNNSDNDDELSWAQIVGYEIIDGESSKTVGTIVRVDDSTVNTLFEVRTIEGSDLLLPASPDLITKVDGHKQQITMAIPKGLLEL